MTASASSTKMSEPDVVDVFVACHREIAGSLRKLLSLVTQLGSDTPQSEQCRSQVPELIEFFTGPARDHNYDEELHVFPTLAANQDPVVKEAAASLCEDHAAIEWVWLDIERQLNSIAEGAPYDLADLLSNTEVFVATMSEHMAQEEALLFPHLRGRIEANAARSINREMASRRGARLRG